MQCIMSSFWLLACSWRTLGLCLPVLVLVLLLSCLTSAAPIPAPNISYCRQRTTVPYNCCAPPSHSDPKPFQFPSFSTLKVRRPAHKVTPDQAQKLASAYRLMRELPQDDPRSFGHQANIHCAYCSEFYAHGNSTVPLQVHGSWLFFPFHRWYLYFHERILAKLVGDETLALPFWNYDHPDGSSIPPMYVQYDELDDSYRDKTHLPPAVAAVDLMGAGQMGPVTREREDQLNINRACFHFVMVSGATTRYRFFGQPYSFGDIQQPGFGTCETMPHNGVHLWVGDFKNGLYDMGLFSTSGRDPLFYAHHNSIDRLWEVWKSLSENNTDIEDPDFLDSELTFYDENAELVKVSVRDSLNVSLLGYTFEEVENQWLSVTPVARSSGVAQLGDDAVICQMGEVLAKPCSAVVARNKQSLFSTHLEAETLVIHGTKPKDSYDPVLINIFVNLPTADASTFINCTEFAGAFSTMSTSDSTDTSVRLGIAFIIRQLNLTLEDNLVVTIVPTSVAATAISIGSISVEYEDVGSHHSSYNYAI